MQSAVYITYSNIHMKKKSKRIGKITNTNTIIAKIIHQIYHALIAQEGKYPRSFTWMKGNQDSAMPYALGTGQT